MAVQESDWSSDETEAVPLLGFHCLQKVLCVNFVCMGMWVTLEGVGGRESPLLCRIQMVV